MSSWIAEGTRLRADRAATRPVQGRSAPARPGTRPAGRHRLAAPVPRPRPGGALPRRVTHERLEVLRKADAIFLDELQASGLVSQDVAGVRGAVAGAIGRRHGRRPHLRERDRHPCVQTDDFMTADWSHLPYELLATMSTRIINEVKGVNRVVYDISSKPPATIEWE